jgi:Kef-type K+ transport system membrane component KefB
VDGQPLALVFERSPPPPGAAPAGAAPPSPAGRERFTAARPRDPSDTVAAFFIAVVVVMLASRLVGAAAAHVGQPRVMGEVLAGILLGPTLLGAVWGDAQSALFPSDIVPVLGVAANLGLIFYMFLVGLEVDPRQLRGRLAQTLAISNTGVLVPMMAGLLIALPTYELVAPDKPFVAFALFMGVSMSITAFPVLARIVVERRMLSRPVGALALAAAAVDDVTAWFFIALAAAVAAAGSALDAVRTVLLAIAFTAAMAVGVRRVLARASVAFDEAGRVPGAWITAIFAGVLASAYVTEQIGIAVIFGAFVMGAVMPRHAGLTEDVTRRVEDFVATILLPLFFAYTGLRTDVGLLDRPALWLLTLALIAVAVICKFGGAVVAARVTRIPWRESAVIGALMNTRGLTELIVLNLALEKGVMSQDLFSALVVMALVTTFMTGPLLRLLDPDNRFGAPVEEALDRARRAARADSPVPVPDRSILVAPRSDAAVAQLVALAEPLARSLPPRELVVARLIAPPRSAAVRGGLQTERRALARAFELGQEARRGLIARGAAARAVAFTSADPGADLVRMAAAEPVDLLLIDGQRALRGAGIARGDVGTVLADAPSDVGVLVARGRELVALGAESPVVVPFGGAEHDWAALELGAWLAGANAVSLRLLGAAGQDDESGGRDASRLLANASLLVQRFAGVAAEPMIAQSGREGIVAAARGAGLLVVGLSDRWRSEGLGPTRSEIVQAAPAPILFVRRGLRAGALAPREDVTRFTWSTPAIGRPPPG